MNEIISTPKKEMYFFPIKAKKATSNKTPVLTKSMTMDIWVVGNSNQLFIRGS